MAVKPQGIVAIIFPIAFFIIIFVAMVGECESCELDSATPVTDHYPKISHDEALNRLEQMTQRINPLDAFVQTRELVELKKANLADTLPDISVIDKHYPLSVTAYGAGSNDIVLEIFCSTEKSGTKEPDNWFTRVAEDFNNSNIRITSGQRIQVKVRYIDSGTGQFYISSRKYTPDGFSPSNHLWLKMIEANGIRVTPFSDRLVGNTAGIVMKSGTYETLKKAYTSVDIRAVIDAVAQGTISMGYTNPYASSTGLNFLVTVLATYSGGDQSKMLSPEVVSSFEAFQKGVPYVAFTTIQMRDSVHQGGILDAFVLEYQTYLREPSLQTGYQFIPFGVRHDNPLYGIGDLSPEKAEAMKALASYATSQSRLADQYKFNADNSYESSYTMPDGNILIEALSLWKQKKDSGRPVAAVFVSDVSGSMDGYPLRNLRIALKEGAAFISPNNAIGLVEYSTRVKRVLPIGTFNALQQSRYQAAIAAMSSEEDTSMFDGIIVGAKMLIDFLRANPDYKPMLFVLTDGNTNEGVFQSVGDIIPVIDALDIPVYSIAYGESVNSSLLKAISSVNEAASMDAKDEAVVNKIGSLLNAEM